MAHTEPEKPKQPGPGLWLSLIIGGVGLVAASLGMWQAYHTVLETVTTPAFEIPGSDTRNLSPGDYEIYVRTGSSFLFDQNQTDIAALPMLDEIVVSNVDSGRTLPIQPLFLEPLFRGTNRYDSVASFTVDSADTYRVEIDSSSDANRAIFARTFETGLEHSIGWLIMIAVGTVLFFLGTVLLIVGMVRRSKAKKTAVPPVGIWQQPLVAPPSVPTTAGSVPPPPRQPTPSVVPTTAKNSPPPTRETSSGDRRSRSETATPWDD